MLRYILMAAAALSLISSSNGCTCLFGPPLSECPVTDNRAALLVTMQCVKSVICDINTGAAVVDVVIDKVFKDKTSLGLSEGDNVTVRSLTQESLCGVGLSFRPGAQWILFARAAPPPLPGGGIPDVFSDGSVCEVGGGDLETGLCDSNIMEPTQDQIDVLMGGC